LQVASLPSRLSEQTLGRRWNLVKRLGKKFPSFSEIPRVDPPFLPKNRLPRDLRI
jgi:hypothetical protein